MPRRSIKGGYGVTRPLIDLNFAELYLSKHLARIRQPVYIGYGDDRLKIETDGTISFEGEATVWEDLRESVTGANLDVVAGTVEYDYASGWVEMSSGGTITDTKDVILVNYQLAHATKPDSVLHVHLHWLQDSATERIITGRYRIFTNGATADLAWTSFTASTSTNSVFSYTSGMITQITDLVEVPLTGAGLSAIVQVQFTRSDANAADTMHVLSVDAHYEIDTVGSRQQFTK